MRRERDREKKRRWDQEKGVRVIKEAKVEENGSKGKKERKRACRSNKRGR